MSDLASDPDASELLPEGSADQTNSPAAKPSRTAPVDPTDLTVPLDDLNRHELLERYSYVQGQIGEMNSRLSQLEARKGQLEQLLGTPESPSTASRLTLS
jgi:hypothetical protein